MLEVCSMCCFTTFVLEVELLVLFLLLLVEVVLFHLLVYFCCTKSLFSCISIAVFYSSVLFFCVLNVFVQRDIEVLLNELKDVEVVDISLFDGQFNDAIVTKMSFQNLRCDTLGVDVCRIVVRSHSLDVHKPSSLDRGGEGRARRCAWSAR